MQEYIPRTLGSSLQAMTDWFPVVSLTGPRQSGKSTLAKHAFPDYDYINLENPQTRAAALEDPISFVRNHPDHLIIDEAQYAPDLFSMIQVVSDEHGTNGQYILTGSHNYLLMKNIHQSLAGRVGMLKLLPFAFRELNPDFPALSPEDFMLKGGYPRIYASEIPPRVYYPNYISTYIERDVAELLDVRNKDTFRNFLTLCANTAGNLLNMASLSTAASVSVPTIKSWLSILESSYIVFLLRPYSSNARKRLTKTPKLFFYDTGLLCHLLGIETEAQLEAHPMLGAIFENLIIAETMKSYLNEGVIPQLYFYRDDSKREVDLIDLTNAAFPRAIEVKSSRTFHAKYATQLTSVCNDLDISADNRYVVARVEESYRTDRCEVVSAREWLMR